MATADAKFILLLFVLFDKEIIDWSLVDTSLAFACCEVVSTVRLLSLNDGVEAESSDGFLFAMREVRLLVEVEGAPILQSVPCTAIFLVDCCVGVVLYDSLFVLFLGVEMFKFEMDACERMGVGFLGKLPVGFLFIS